MKYYIGIDLGGTNIVAGVVNENYELLAKAHNKTNVGRPAEQIALTMAQTAQQAVQNAGLQMEQISLVGIGTPGIVDPVTKEVVCASNLNFSHVPLCRLVEEHLNRPVFIANDADAAAYGEFMAGAGKSEAICWQLPSEPESDPVLSSTLKFTTVTVMPVGNSVTLSSM